MAAGLIQIQELSYFQFFIACFSRTHHQSYLPLDRMEGYFDNACRRMLEVLAFERNKQSIISLNREEIDSVRDFR